MDAPKDGIIPEGDHGLHDPKDGPVVPEQILSEGDELLALPPLEESLRVLVEPRLVPARQAVHLLHLLRRFHVFQVPDHHDRLVFRVHRHF